MHSNKTSGLAESPKRLFSRNFKDEMQAYKWTTELIKYKKQQNKAQHKANTAAHLGFQQPRDDLWTTLYCH